MEHNEDNCCDPRKAEIGEAAGLNPNLYLHRKWRKRTMPAKGYHLSYGNVFSSSVPPCKGYLGIVLREPGRNTPVRAVNGHCLKCGSRLAWIVIKGNQAARHQLQKNRYARPAKTLEREAMLKRLRELGCRDRAP